jgi:hypothetical protein
MAAAFAARPCAGSVEREVTWFVMKKRPLV